MNEKKQDVYIIITQDDDFHILHSEGEAKKFIAQEMSEMERHHVEIYKANRVYSKSEIKVTISDEKGE